MLINDDANRYCIAFDSDKFMESVNHPEWDEESETFIFPWMRMKVMRDNNGKIFAAEIIRRIKN